MSVTFSRKVSQRTVGLISPFHCFSVVARLRRSDHGHRPHAPLRLGPRLRWVAVPLLPAPHLRPGPGPALRGPARPPGPLRALRGRAPPKDPPRLGAEPTRRLRPAARRRLRRGGGRQQRVSGSSGHEVNLNTGDKIFILLWNLPGTRLFGLPRFRSSTN